MLKISLYQFLSKRMKHKTSDIIKRTIITVIWSAFLAYIVYLFGNNQIIVQDQYKSLNMLFYVLLVVIIGYKVFFFGIKPKAFFAMKITKASLFVIGIILILLWNYVLLNDIENKIYIGDLITVLWVIITILSPTNILITKKVKKQKQSSKMEVIEA